MVAAGFGAVFLGIETPSETALRDAGKTQNLRMGPAEAVAILARAGLEVMSGFIVGFDSDDAAALRAQGLPVQRVDCGGGLGISYRDEPAPGPEALAGAIRATLELMAAPAERVRDRHSYNLAGISFTPLQIAAAIRQRIPSFTMDCVPDFRQAIAASWPRSIDDSAAQRDWGWRPRYDLDAMVADMLANLRRTLARAA